MPLTPRASHGPRATNSNGYGWSLITDRLTGLPTWSQRVAPLAEQPWRWCPVSARLHSVRVCCGARPGLRGPRPSDFALP